MTTKTLFTHVIHDARDLAETLADVMREAKDNGGDLATVYFSDALRLRLVKETLTDGSTVLNLDIAH